MKIASAFSKFTRNGGGLRIRGDFFDFSVESFSFSFSNSFSEGS